MAPASDGTDVPVSPLRASSSNMGSPNGSLPDFEGTGYRASTMEEKINEMFVQVAKLPLLIQSVSGSKIASKRFPRQWPRMMRKSRILNKWLAALQPVLPHWKRMQRPYPVDPAWQDLGIYSDIAMAPPPLGRSGPMAQGHLMTIEIQDEDLTRSQAPKMNSREVPFYYGSLGNNTTKGLRSGSITFGKNPISCNKLVRIHCKAGSMSVRLVFETRAKCQDFVARYKDDAIPYAIDSPFCCTTTNIIVSQSKSIEDREIGKQFAPLSSVLAEQLKILFPDGDDEGAFIIPALDARKQVLSIKDRRNGVGKPVFKLAPLGSRQTFTLVTPELSIPGVSPEVLQRVLSQANKVNV